MKLMSLTRGLFAGALALTAAAASASVVYTFDATEVAAFGSAPYGTVTLVENGSNVDVTVNLRSDLDFVLTGGPHSIFSLNINDAVVDDIQNIAFWSGPDGPAFPIAIAPGENTPYGEFDFMVDCTDNKACGGQGGSNLIQDPLTFTVLNSTYGDFGVENADGASFAADVICVSGSCNGATGAIAVTGPGVPNGGGGGGGTPVPLPGTAALLGLGLLAAGFARRGKA